jgi:hypothetical protein
LLPVAVFALSKRLSTVSPSEQFVAQLEVIALPDLPGRKQPYDLDAGKCSISTSTASAVVADSF